jgi:NADH-quinone oxidoreductase subunit N
MTVYVVMTAGAFLCVLWMRDGDGEPIETIASMSGLSQRQPGFAFAMFIFMFSLAGVPPMFGFWPKLLVFDAAVASGYVALAVAGILGAVIGAYYYLKIVKVMYHDAPAEPYARVRVPVQGAHVLLAAVAVSPLGYLLIGPLGSLADRAAGTLF